MEDKKLTEKESLEVITSMIARTKQHYIGNGRILLMWGYLAVATTILVWIILVTTRQAAWNWLWFAIPVVGYIATPIMTRRQNADCGAVTYLDRIASRIWTVCGVSEAVLTLMCLGLHLLAGINGWSAILAYTLIAVPFAVIAQGLVIKENSLTFGGIVGLAIGLVTICCMAGRVALAANWFLPLFILSMVAMMIIPGHILNSKAKRK